MLWTLRYRNVMYFYLLLLLCTGYVLLQREGLIKSKKSVWMSECVCVCVCACVCVSVRA